MDGFCRIMWLSRASRDTEPAKRLHKVTNTFDDVLRCTIGVNYGLKSTADLALWIDLNPILGELIQVLLSLLNLGNSKGILLD